MSTEYADPRFEDLDGRPLPQVMRAICESQQDAVRAVEAALPQITAATKAAAQSLGEDGRIIYVGAGTSIRVAVQDGSELPPTFNWPFKRLGFVIAGGERALIESQEGAEDDVDDALFQIDALNLTNEDVVIGLAASGTTPFTVAAIRRAREDGAITIGIANNADTPLLAAAQYPILMDTGSELIAGSTRMKAGTSQKVVLNMISSGIMIELGRVYRGLMVDMQISNKKLAGRAVKMIARIAGCDETHARSVFDASGGNIKLASLMATGLDKAKATSLLEQSGGNLRTAFSMLEKAA